MFTTGLIAFREFFEAFLITGVFLGVSKKLNLKKEPEIILAAGIGILFSLLLSSFVYFFGTRASSIFNEKTAKLLESYLMVFSGFFIVYVVFSLHQAVRRGQGQLIISAHRRLREEVFDLSLFMTIVSLVCREGAEIALFSASVSLFSTFAQNMFGLMFGFLIAIILAAATLAAYIRFPIAKIFKATEYLMIILGASLTQRGLTGLFITYINFDLSKIIPFNLFFIPEDGTFIGHIVQSFFGVDNSFSLAKLAIMLIYVIFVYRLFLNKKKLERSQSPCG